MGGETLIAKGHTEAAAGPSPRGRGNPATLHGPNGLDGSIPAWAGKPLRVEAALSMRGVHPRVGGETPKWPNVRSRVAGPSPRGRGNRAAATARRYARRSIPAWAGKPRASSPADGQPWVHPRVGGETLECPNERVVVGGPSPRGRGNHPYEVAIGSDPGSIPAWAGKPKPPGERPSRYAVHPRVGGETCGCRSRRA